MTETSARSANDNGTARDEILAAIRDNLSVSKPFDAIRREHHGHHAERVLVRSDNTGESVVDNFRASLEMVGAHFTLADGDKAAAKLVEGIIEKLGAKRVAISGSDVVARVVEAIKTTQFIERAPADVLFDCDLGITSAQWAIAETGTLVLESEMENHRLTSLVPTVHLCILKASRIRQTLAEILELTSKNLSRTITFITGASRTSDIELTLAIGVHGPAELYVVVLADE
jgi:L-lactate dehydrogenase complex protein LldG